MSFKFIEAKDINREQYLDYIAEWKRHGGTIVPASSDPKDETFEQMLQKWSDEKSIDMYERGWVPATTYFLVDQQEKIYGSLNLRYALNDYLLKAGGTYWIWGTSYYEKKGICLNDARAGFVNLS